MDPTLVERKDKLLAQAEENLHRENLNPVEEAAILTQLMEARGIDVREAGELMGKSYRQARRLQQIQAAAPPIKRALARGQIDGRMAVEMVRVFGKLAREDETPGSAVALRRIDALIERVVREHWSLRRIERHAARIVGGGAPEAGEDEDRSETATVGATVTPVGAPREAPSAPANPGALCSRLEGRIVIDLTRLEHDEIAPEERAALIALLEELLTKTRHAKVRV